MVRQSNISFLHKWLRVAPAPIAFLMASTLFSPLGALAQEDADPDRVERLESQLEQVLDLVESLRSELETLKAERASTPAADDESLSQLPLSQRIEQVEASVNETNQRLNDVEDMTFDLDEKVGGRALVRAFDAEEFDLGGFLHTGVTLVDGKNNTEAAVNRMTFELLAKAQISDDWSLFVAQAFIRESNINFVDEFSRLEPDFNIGTSAPLVIATATYEHSDALKVDLGRFITPHGIVNIEHFPALLLDPEQPQFLRPFGGQTIFANFLNGAKIGGEVFAPGGVEGSLGYSAYVGTFVNNAGSFNYGGRAFWQFANTGLTIGANVGGGRRDGDGTGYFLYGADILYDEGPVIWKNEIFVTDEDQGGDRLAFYTQPGLRFADNWTAFYRFDFLDDGTRTGDRKEHAVGLTFKPHRNVHLRAIARLNRFDAATAAGFPEANAENYQFTATFSF